MIFTDDTEDALRAAVWLVNSAEDPDTLVTLEDEERFLTAYPYTGRIYRDAAELEELRALRPRLRAMLLAPRDEMVAQVNAALAESTLMPQLRRHDGLDWHLHAVADDRPLAERVLIETTMALIDVIRADEGGRISVCADDGCHALALDLSRNRSKRYCSTTCANRNAVAAYRARRSARH
ncbi:CGNR zinc finger domain-containing protein [Microbacterium sp. EF45047]|uniref:CGNR zinc finger domain-containing protein n=1 Tax=Microbacterium sp. EF45047 TaxID=2809708 RepID=UPI002349D8E3|nr:CGNR zinc finger domain-containing protein [Microbacterium sp. EF45047]WCM55487.1 CGNR zinc finger domain-containing protein [Microbacterium sp. EF45047]